MVCGVMPHSDLSTGLPTLRQLRAFAAVAETGSFTAAAQQLHLTQSALSVLVRELEREIAVGGSGGF